MHRGDESNFVAANIKHGEFSDLIDVREGRSRLHEIQKPAFPHDRVPVHEGRTSVRVPCRELVQAFPRNDVHSAGELPHKLFQ